jgi:hypothetical protein
LMYQIIRIKEGMFVWWNDPSRKIKKTKK